MISTRLARRYINDVGIDLVSASCVAHRFRPHFHSDFALSVIAGGRQRLRCASGTHTVSAGDMVVVNPREIHGEEPVDGLPWRYSTFFIPPQLLADLGSGSPPWFPAAVIREPQLAGELASLHDQLRDAADSVPRARLAATLRTFVARYGTAWSGPAEYDVTKPHQRARQYLDERWATPIRLGDVSRVAEVSVFHPVRSFKQAFGITPGAYLRQVRIGHAQRMLRAGRPVAEVAKATVFSDQSHFTRRFKETLGYPPGAYLRVVLTKAVGWIGSQRDPTR